MPMTLPNPVYADPVPAAAFPARASGIAPSGTLAANGTLTLGTALNRIYTEGLWLYLPAAAFAASAAGLYYCVMSSTTVGQVFTNGPGSGLATGSAAGYTGVTTAQAVMSVTIPANLMGPRGALRITALIKDTNNANNKGAGLTFGATSTSISNNSSIAGKLLLADIVNENSAAVQTIVQTNRNAANNPVPQFVAATTDTSAAVTLAINLQLAVATDYSIVQTAYVESIPVP